MGSPAGTRKGKGAVGTAGGGIGGGGVSAEALSILQPRTSEHVAQRFIEALLVGTDSLRVQAISTLAIPRVDANERAARMFVLHVCVQR